MCELEPVLAIETLHAPHVGHGSVIRLHLEAPMKRAERPAMSGLMCCESDAVTVLVARPSARGGVPGLDALPRFCPFEARELVVARELLATTRSLIVT